MIINIPPHGKCIECAHWKSGKERNRPFAGCEIYGHEDPEYSGEMCDEFEASPAKPSGSKDDTVDIIEHARAIKEYCKKNLKTPHFWCESCPLYKVMCQPVLSVPCMWDLPEPHNAESER